MNNDLIHVNTLPPFKRMCVSIGALPTSFMESMSYYEALEWLYKYLADTVIPTVNNNGEAVTELQTAFITLKDYVDNYFENLDVQEEINNKLDEMAESGELTDIIAQYLGLAGVLAFNTVADMKLAENLVNGSTAKTMGYHQINDGGSGLYKVREITNSDVIDEATIISVSNNLIAELIYNDINVNQFGAYGDGIHDDTTYIQKAIDKASEYNTINFVDKCVYLITQTLNIPKDININGHNATIKLSDNFNSGYAILYNSTSGGSAISIYPKNTSIIQNLVVSGNESNFTNNNFLMICQQVEICNIRFENINHCIYFTNDYIDRAEVHNIYVNNRTGSDYAIYSGSQGDAKYFHHIQYGGVGSNVNLLEIGTNIVHALIENIVAGSLKVSSNADIKNIMLSYYAKINIIGGDCNLENIQYTKNKINEYRIIVNNSGRKLPNIWLNNVKGFFINQEVEYNTTPINSINIINCNSYKLTNVLTGNRYGDAYELTALAFEKVDFGTSIVNKSYNDHPIELNDKLIYAKNYQDIEIPEPYLVQALRSNTPSGVFKGTAGTYYYRWICGVEINNGFYKNSNETSITISDTLHTPRIELNYSNNSHMPDSIRIFRGTTSGTYTEYADVTYCNDVLVDTGVAINGIAWHSMSEDGVTYAPKDNNTLIKHLRLEAIGSNGYLKKYTARYNPIDRSSWFASSTFTKGTILYDYNEGLGIYIYDGTTWNKI